MSGVWDGPSATAFDAVTALASAGVYLIVALAALAYAPRDPRVRAFLATAVAGIAPYWVTAQFWAWGWRATLSKGTILFLALSLMIGSLALFHFTQLFPWRRPWIRAHRRLLWAAYAAAPVPVVFGALLIPDPGFAETGGIGAVSAGAGLVIALVLGLLFLTAVFVLGLVVPFGALMSLHKSWLAARTHGIESARSTTLWMLVSQLGGGVLTILVIPLLHIVAPGGFLVVAASALLFASAMMMPVAFALGVWRLRVLEVDIEGLPQ